YIVRCVEYCNDIVSAQCPKKLLHCNAEFLCQFLYGIGPLCSVFDVANSLIGEAREDNVSGHDDFSLTKCEANGTTVDGGTASKGACLTSQQTARRTGGAYLPST